MSVITTVCSVLQNGLYLFARLLLGGTQHQRSRIVSISSPDISRLHLGQLGYSINQIIPLGRHPYKSSIARITESIVCHLETIATHFAFGGVIDSEYPAPVIEERQKSIRHHFDSDIRLVNRTANTETVSMMKITAVFTLIGSDFLILGGKIIINGEFFRQQRISERIQC